MPVGVATDERVVKAFPELNVPVAKSCWPSTMSAEAPGAAWSPRTEALITQDPIIPRVRNPEVTG